MQEAPTTLLIVDDDLLFCEALSTTLMEEGYKVLVAGTLARARELLKKHAIAVAFIDVHLPDGNGLDLLAGLSLLPAPPEAIVITAQGDPDGAENAITSGAWDYVQKPADMGSILLMVQRALLMRERKRHMPEISGDSTIVANSGSMRQALLQMFEAAQSDAPALIIGETGTGKELIARTVHKNSRRAQGPFIVVDCGAIAPSLLESELFGSARGAYTGATQARQGLVIMANGGTLFLDEVGELALEQQKVFLRLIQERSYRPLGSTAEMTSDFRVVAATNRNLQEMADKGTFRADLLFRLQGVNIEAPPVRNRGKDVYLLVQHALRRAISQYNMKPKVFSSDALQALASYAWPGNVREILHTVEAAALTSADDPLILLQHLPVHLRAQVARSRVEETATLRPRSLGVMPAEKNALTGSIPHIPKARHVEDAFAMEGLAESGYAIRENTASTAFAQARQGQDGDAVNPPGPQRHAPDSLIGAGFSAAAEPPPMAADGNAARQLEQSLPLMTDSSGKPLSWTAFHEQELFEIKRRYLLRLLSWADGKVPLAAEAAGLSRQRLYTLLREHGISRHWEGGQE